MKCRLYDSVISYWETKTKKKTIQIRKIDWIEVFCL